MDLQLYNGTVMRDPLAPAMLADCVIEKPLRKASQAMPQGIRDARHISMLSRLEPADDNLAGAPTPVCLVLNPVEIERVRLRAVEMGEASRAAIEAEAEVARCERLAMLIDSRTRAAGAAAAAAFGNAPGAQEAAARASSDLRECEMAALALGALKGQAKMARDAMHIARAALSVAVTDGMAAARRRAADEFTAAAATMLRCVAHLGANLQRLPSAQQMLVGTSWNAFFLRDLRVPALPGEVGGRPTPQIEVMNSAPTLLAPQHSHLTAQTTAAESWLSRQLSEAIAPSGLSVGGLLK